MFASLQNYQSFDENLFAAVDAGYDCDISGSMAGGLAGALLGEAGIHARWLEELEYREELIQLAEGLHQMAEGRAPA